MNLSPPTHLWHDARQEVVPPVDYLMAATAERHEVLAPVVGGVLVDVVPVEPLLLAAPFAVLGLGVQAVRLLAAGMSVLGLLALPRLLRHAEVSVADRFLDVLRARCPCDRIPVALEPAVEAVGSVPGDGLPAVRALVAEGARFAARGDSRGPVVALIEGVERLVDAAFATRFRHVTSLPSSRYRYCRLAAWRTRDPGERARALGVPKPPPIPEGQGSLFDGLEAS